MTEAAIKALISEEVKRLVAIEVREIEENFIRRLDELKSFSSVNNPNSSRSTCQKIRTQSKKQLGQLF